MKIKRNAQVKVKQESIVKRYFLALVIFLGLLPVVGTAVIYYRHFYCKLGYPLSDDSATWGTFGDFIGGITNPIYAYLAFAGVIYALILQREQTEMMREHRKLEDLGTMMESVSSTLHASLFEKMVTVKGRQCSVNDALLAISDVSLRAEIDPDGPDAMLYEDERSSVVVPISYQLVYVQEQLELLAHCLKMYVDNGGPTDIVDLYRARYKRVAFMMDQIRYLFLPDVLDFFGVVEEKKVIIAAQRGEVFSR